MRIKLKPKPPKRKRGERAGLTRAAVVNAATILLDDDDNGFNFHRLAKRLGVGPTSVRSLFRGNVHEIRAAFAHAELSHVVRPCRVREDPAAYLIDLVERLLQRLDGRPVAAAEVVLQLARNPYLHLAFVERICACLAGLAVPPERVMPIFARTMGLMQGLVMQQASDFDLTSVQDGLTTEFPALAAAGLSGREPCRHVNDRDGLSRLMASVRE